MKLSQVWKAIKNKIYALTEDGCGCQTPTYTETVDGIKKKQTMCEKHALEFRKRVNE